MIPRAELTTVVRAGVRQGRTELRIMATTTSEVLSFVLPTAGFLTAMIFLRGEHVPGTAFSLGSNSLPSFLGAAIAMTGVLTLSLKLAEERMDGTLLRAKALPHGMTGYLIGKIVTVTASGLVGFVVTLVVGMALLPGLSLNTASDWLTLLWVVALGFVASLPIGAVIGSIFSEPAWTGLITLPVFGLIGISGVFYPITHFPVWLQDVAQVFPLYWVGLGLRSALLPDNMTAVEIGGSWRHLATFGVLAAWAALGLLLAPVVLRRMARKESGSNMERRKARAIARAH
ncbi:MAG TPA: ABC transporter permease [Pseudonocardiaceae bacterium]|jgi:ABC-2 type transport system permease protein|nr:ABC transporter permease [Pseudonocardiaceae bacterium]